MVSFGTNQGPIIPRQSKSATTQQKTVVTRSPAPVSEEREDVPNPNLYKAPVPHQYRTELYSFRPPSDLVLGTPLDQKYTPSVDKKQQRKQFVRDILGVEYTGPHTFEKQEYELLEAKKNRLAWKYNKPHYFQQVTKRDEGQVELSQDTGDAKYVPQIGVVYSAGVRYYIPQFVYYNQPVASDNPDLENSIYDEEDAKYQH